MSRIISTLATQLVALLMTITATSAIAAPIDIAIANYGPHPTLQETIEGFKQGMTQAGYKEGEEVKYDISDVNFDPTLIPQMLTKLTAGNPAVLVALTTPVAQAAKHSITQIPIVFSAITDPVQAGLLTDKQHGAINLSGASDQQNLDAFLAFAKRILPQATRVGLLYASGEDNDHALVNMMQAAAKAHNMTVVAFPIDSPRDIPIRTRQFKDKVDFIYVGTSGPIQPSLPAIVSVANELKIPVFNVDASAVEANQVLGSFAVSYHQVGMNTANIVVQVLKGKQLKDIPPLYPSLADHHAYVSQKNAEQLGIKLPTDLTGITVIQ